MRWPPPADRWDIGSVIVLLVLVVATGVVGALPWVGHFDTPGPWIALAIEAMISPIFLWRKEIPILSGVVGTLGSLLAVLLSPPAETGQLSVFLSVNVWMQISTSVTVNSMVHYGKRTRRVWIIWGLLAVVTVVAARPWDPHFGSVYGGLTLISAPALVGAYLAARGRLVQELRERAEQAERDQEQAAELARAQERMRLASDLHDVVTHRISLMVLQAGAIRMSTVDPEVREAAERLRTVGCEALEELRDMIGVLRIDVKELA
ncbi:sensor histidine kinase [Fodinicola acaciae]|uniref:sensor histidine kinase n=1 Tax=Fodinicola acaciae TaxID=2681555 RepID=UPI0013D696C1|nr:histidine kinase [Fodinicola acaciae]